MQPLISIIVPVWNVDGFIEKCLDSLLVQTYTNLQIILIDDGSEDASGEICDIYAQRDNRVEVIHQKNAGVCHARNVAMESVRGEYIGFVDPDDWTAPDMFEYLLKGIIKYKADIACCRYYRVAAGQEICSLCDGENIVYTGKQAIDELVNRFVLRNVFWNKLFRKDVFDDIKFPEGMIYEGTAMVYKLFLKAERVVSLGEPKYYYVDNPKSYVNQKSIKHTIDYVRAHMIRYKDLKDEIPEIREKLMRELLQGILKFQYLYRYSKEELEKYQKDFKDIQIFLKDEREYIDCNVKLEQHQKKELKSIARFTQSGWKRARRRAALIERKDRIFKSIRVGEEKQKVIPQTVKYDRDIYNEINQRILKQVQRCELDILKQVHQLCEKNGLQYYLYGGTLLGAVRHKGFIPWDDDIDIVMPWKDYKRFVQLAEKELGKQYFCQTCFSDEEFPHLYTKIRRKDSYICEEKWMDKNLNSGIFIDILPLVGIPDGKTMQGMFLHAVSFMHQVCTYNRPRTQKRFTRICFWMVHSLPKKERYKLRNMVLKLSNTFKGKKYVCSYGSHYMPVRRRILKKQWFSGKDMIEFEGCMFYVPSGWREYLEYLFGVDYMQLPPENAREVHLMLTRTKFPSEMKEVNDETI